MPIYAYRCQDCSATYEERRKFEQSREPSTCPSCKGTHVQRLISAPNFIRTGISPYSQPSTVGAGCACSSGGACACRATS